MKNTNKHILLVEDESVIALNTEKILTRHNFKVTTVHSGEAAICAAREYDDIDLILMDIDLGPGIDGTKAAKKIIAEKDLPVVFISNHTEPEVISKTEEITSYGYVVKNTGETVLLTSIRMAFKLHDAHMEIKKSEAVLKQKEELFRTTLDASNDAVHIIDTDFNLLWTNNNMIDLSKQAGFDITHSSGKKLDTVFPFLPDSVFDEYRQVIKTGEAVSSIEANKLGRKTFYTETNKYPIIDNGIIKRIVTVIRDMSDSRIMEEKLRDSESRLRNIFDNTQAMIIIKDRDLKVSYINNRAAELLGLPEDEILGKSDSDFYPEEDLKIINETDRKILSTGEPVEVMETANLGSEKLYFNSIKFPIKNHAGRITGVGGIITDITEKVRLEESNRHIRQIIDSYIEAFDEIVYEWSPAKDVVKWGGNYTEILGYGSDEIGSDTESWLDRVHPDDQAWVKKEIDNAIEEKRNYNLDYRFLKKDGTYLWMHDSGITYLNDAGTLERIIGIFRNIHEWKMTEASIKKALDEKEALLNELQHRVKNSLTMIDSMIAIEADNAEDPATRETISRISDRIMSVSQLYSLLYTSDSIREIDLNTYLQNIIQSLQASYGYRKSIAIDTTLEKISLDVKRAIPFGLILTELVTNCYKHAFTEKKEGSISILLKKIQGSIKLMVSDNGSGLPEHFDLNATESLGLKLAVMLTSQLEGYITHIQKGNTLFEVTIPL